MSRSCSLWGNARHSFNALWFSGKFKTYLATVRIILLMHCALLLHLTSQVQKFAFSNCFFLSKSAFYLVLLKSWGKIWIISSESDFITGGRWNVVQFRQNDCNTEHCVGSAFGKKVLDFARRQIMLLLAAVAHLTVICYFLLGPKSWLQLYNCNCFSLDADAAMPCHAFSSLASSSLSFQMLLLQ